MNDNLAEMVKESIEVIEEIVNIETPIVEDNNSETMETVVENKIVEVPILNETPTPESSISDETEITSDKMIEPIVTNKEATEMTLPDSDVNVEEIITLKKVTEIPLTNFHGFMTDNWRNIPNLNFQKISAEGVDPNQTISFTLPDPKDETGTVRKMYHFTDAHLIRLPDLPLDSFTMLNDKAFKLTQIIIPDVLFLKSYSTGNILFSCLYLKVNNQYLPIEKMRVKKKSDELKFDFEVEKIDELVNMFRTKFVETVDSEIVVILYHQSSNVQELFTTYQSVIDWFNLRISKIVDIHHLLQIDNVLIKLFIG